MADVGVWGLRARAVFESGRAADGESVDERVVKRGCVLIASAGLKAAGLTAAACELVATRRVSGDVCLPALRPGRMGDMVESGEQSGGVWREMYRCSSSRQSGIIIHLHWANKEMRYYNDGIMQYRRVWRGVYCIFIFWRPHSHTGTRPPCSPAPPYTAHSAPPPAAPPPPSRSPPACSHAASPPRHGGTASSHCSPPPSP